MLPNGKRVVEEIAQVNWNHDRSTIEIEPVKA
jgi:hypothetical protein